MPDTDMKTGELTTGAGAHALAFSGDGRMAYVSNQAAASVNVVAVASSSVVKNIPVGNKPNGLLWRAK